MHSGAKDEHDISANFLRYWQTELDDIAQDLESRATKTWKKPASFALTLSGAAVALATGIRWLPLYRSGSRDGLPGRLRNEMPERIPIFFGHTTVMG